MLYIGQVEYKMSKDDKWNKGWLVGEHIDNANTLLDENFIPVPKLIYKGEEYLYYDAKRDMFSGIMIQL